MSHPTLRIFAFSPARVNGGLCILPLQASANGEIVGTVEMMRTAAESILAVTGPSPRISNRKPGSGLHGKQRLRRITAATIAKYQAVVARVKAGANWRDAAAAEGVKHRTVYSWHWKHMEEGAAP